METELIDIFDKDRRPMGRTVPRCTRLQPGEYRLVVHVCIFDSKNRLLIQLRSSAKPSYGGLWDVSAGGHSMAGENSSAAAHRELKEELGLDHDFTGTDPVMCMNFPNGFDDYYIINENLDSTSLDVQESEVSWVKWASLDEIYSLIDSGEFLPYHKSFFTLLFDINANGLDFLRK